MNLTERVRESIGTAVVSVLTRWEKLESGTAYTLTKPGFIANPHPLYRELRENDPVHRSRLTGGYLFTRYDDVLALFRDSRLSMEIRNAKIFPQTLAALVARGVGMRKIRSFRPTHLHDALDRIEADAVVFGMTRSHLSALATRPELASRAFLLNEVLGRAEEIADPVLEGADFLETFELIARGVEELVRTLKELASLEPR